MKAIYCTKYGSPDVLKLEEIHKPVPTDNEVLIRVKAASVNFGDLLARKFNDISPRKFHMPFIFWFLTKLYFGIRKPRIKILGSEYSGIIESTGINVKAFKQGDEVFGYAGQRMGAYAEYLCLPENSCLTIKPENMSFEESAALPYGGIIALSILKKLDIKQGQKVLINGASGGIGSSAVQLAKYYGAEVTGICSTLRLDFVKSLGADHVIDYTKEDFTQTGITYDFIIDILGKSSFAYCKNSLSEKGRYVYVSFKVKQLCLMLLSLSAKKKVICAMASEKVEDLILIKKLCEAGIFKSIIDKIYHLEQITDAHRYVEMGQRKGNVIIAI